MFFAPLDRIRRTISLRLTIWYSSILVGSFLIIFAVAYFYLSLLLQEFDRHTILAEFSECLDLFQRDGIEGVQKEVELEQRMVGRNPFFVQLAGPDQKTIFLNLPDEWKGLDRAAAERGPIESGIVWFHLHKGDREYELMSFRLADGHIMRVGKAAENRRALLKRFYAYSALVIVAVMVLSFIGGLQLASRTLTPLRKLIGQFRTTIATGSMDIRATTGRTGDELDELATLFNGLLERIKLLISGMQGALDNIAHDLRTPLMRLQAIAETALNAEADPEVLREALMDSLEESKQISLMLNALMDISESEAGTMKLNPSEVNLQQLIEDVVDLYGFVAEGKEISVQSVCDQGLHVTADPIRMRQALANLLDNALKYTRPGGRVEIEAHQVQAEIIITVTDTGIGIAPGELPNVWDRLYRGDQSRSERGLGLGLSLVKAIVQAHGGKVAASSKPGVGSEFSITLPKGSQIPSDPGSSPADRNLTNL
jgi:signal transduction histidine kinase